MATAPVQSFQDYPAEFAVATAVRAYPDPRAPGDTLNDVINDDARRNQLIENNLLKGVQMISGGPVISARELIARPSTLKAVINQSASIQTTTVEAEFTEKLMQSNYSSVSVQVSAPYVTASADYSEETSYVIVNTETQKTIMTSWRYLFPQGRIDISAPGSGFQDDVQLNPEFTDAINAALAKSSKLDQREALDAVFNEFGHVYRTKVQMGGTLSAHTMETFYRSENETSEWGAGVTAGHGNTQTTITTEQGRTLDVKYLVEGGDYTKIQKSDEWIASTSNSEFWRVIEVDEVVAVVDMLPDPVKETVKTLMVPLLGEWVPVGQAPNTAKFPVAIYQPADPLPAGWYWLAHAADSTRALIVKPTLPSKAGRNVAVADAVPGSGFTTQPFPTLPDYAFLSTFFGVYSPGVAPGSGMGALRPGLFLEGSWTLMGTNLDTMVYITHPNKAQDPIDDCYDLQSVVQVVLPGDNPPKPRWAIRKNVILFDYGEQ
ncbi:erylysin B [Cerioporus squamosus]|nr:erylysin B [Cerioporus squamosus]